MKTITHPGTGQRFKLGRNRPLAFGPRLSLGNYLYRKFPAAPPSADYSVKADGFMRQILGNDICGDCVLEGTAVSAPNAKRAFRAKYDGPAVRITLASGKRLAVTANHLVFTPRGAVAAKAIKENDYLIGTCRTEIFPDISVVAGGQSYINQKPVVAQEIFSTLSLSGDSIRKVMPVPVDLHGDGKFINSYVDIVGTDGLLGSKFDASLGQPNAQTKISSARELQRHFQRLSSAFKGGGRRLSAALGDISLCGHRPSFVYGHSGISQSDALSERSQFMAGGYDRLLNPPSVNSEFFGHLLHRFAGYIPFDGFTKVAVPQSVSKNYRFAVHPDFTASGAHSASEGHAADAVFARNILDAFPGIVAPDRVVDIKVEHFRGHVYDFSTDQNWYIADGILTHNCTCAAAYHIAGMFLANTDQKIPFNTANVLTTYQTLSGWNGVDNDVSDTGCDELTVLDYWSTTGLVPGAHKITAAIKVDGTDQGEMQAALWLFENIYFAMGLPDAWINPMPSSSGFIWDVAGPENQESGHAFCGVGYNPQGIIIDTWGMLGIMTWAAVAKYPNTYTVLGSDIVDKITQKAPNGFNWTQLVSDLQSMGADEQ